MSKITSSYADYQTFPTLFELESVVGKKVTVDFTAPELSSLVGEAFIDDFIASYDSVLLRKNPGRLDGNIKVKSWQL